MTEVDRIENGSLAQNCYVVARGDDAVIIDPGGGFEQIAASVEASGLSVHAVLNTHGHVDHLGAVVSVVEEYGAPFHLHPDDAYLLPGANFYGRFLHGAGRIRIPRIDVPLDGVTSLEFGALTVGVVHTPGHTPGSVCFDTEGDLFTGDTLTAGHVGRTDLPGSDRGALEASIAQLAERISPDTMIRPGHGEPARVGDVLADWSSLPELRG